MLSFESDKDSKCSDWQQIKRDLNRSFPQCPLFADGSIGQQQLERVLMTFTKYDPNIGYVQGMNFIVGALLYHSNEEISFWLFVSLVEDYEMREIYLPNFPGLYKHTQIIDMLIFEKIREIYQHFVYFYCYCSVIMVSKWKCLAPNGYSQFSVL